MLNVIWYVHQIVTSHSCAVHNIDTCIVRTSTCIHMYSDIVYSLCIINIVTEPMVHVCWAESRE